MNWVLTFVRMRRIWVVDWELAATSMPRFASGLSGLHCRSVCPRRYVRDPGTAAEEMERGTARPLLTLA
jgi:hypothetical protein